MVAKKKSRLLSNALLDQYPDLKDALKPSDHYAELKEVLKINVDNLPHGSLNTKIIINAGEIVERVYRTPNGEIISLFPKPSNIFFDKAA